MVYKYLGYGVTDSNGVAKLDHDAEGQELQHSYTGVGAGEVDVVASLDNPVSSGSIVSGTFNVFDCFFYDEGLSTEGHHNDNWHNQGNSVNVSRSPTETTLTQAVVGTTGFYQQPIQHRNYIIDFDYYCNVQNQVVSIRKEGDVLRWLYLSDWGVEADTWCHVKFIINGTDLRISVNDVERSYTLTDVPNRFVFRLQDNQEIKYKNFKMYIGGDDSAITINATNPVIQSTEQTIIKGILYIDGELQKNTNIDVYKNDVKVDTVSTGSTGTASYTYTGVGDGEVEFQFRYGSILSQICTITDAQFRDGGKYGDKNPNWTPSNITAKCDEGDNYTTLSNSSSSNGDYTISATVDYTTPFVIEFDNKLTSDNKNYIFILGSSNTVFTFSSRSITGNCHVKLIVDENVRVFVDGEEKNSVTLSSAPTGFRFRIPSGGVNIGYSNFVIYSI